MVEATEGEARTAARERPAMVYGTRARLGLIVPPTNTANEAEWAQMVPPGVTVHVARMPLHTDTESDEGRRALYADVERAASDLAQASVDVIAYGCTAGSMTSPMTAICDFVTGLAAVPSVTTAASLVEALRALGASRVALATPYHDALNEHERAFLGANGVEVVAMAGLGIGGGGAHEYVRIARVPLDEVRAHALAVDRPEAEALLISCTDFATLPLLADIEAELGKPVVTSNQATLWAALRAAGIDDRFERFGRLLAEH
jgi:maleate isomerase/arylmalonate decarboxylase